MMRKIMKLVLTAAMASGLLAAAPASAAIFEYEMTNGDILTINSDTSTATWKGDSIDATMTSNDFANFTGGERPRFTATLTSLDGTRLINGRRVTDNPRDIDTTHPQKLIGMGRKFNLWAWWGDPISGGDYVRKIRSYSVTQVPAPGMAALFALALVMIGFGRRRRKSGKKTEGGMGQMALAS